MVIIGLLSFLKKKKEFSLDNLDVPPAPPPGLNEEKTAETGFSEEEFSPEIERIEASLAKEKVPKKEKAIGLPPLPELEEELPEFPSIPGIGEDVGVEEPKLREEFIKAEVEPVHPLETEEKEKIEVEEEAKPKEITKPIFLKIETFKNVLDDVNFIKTSLKGFGDVLDGLAKEERGENRLYEKFKNSLNDIQNKLKFVDQTLFK